MCGLQRGLGEFFSVITSNFHNNRNSIVALYSSTGCVKRVSIDIFKYMLAKADPSGRAV